MLDSTAKIPAGLWHYNYAQYGAFDQCLSIDYHLTSEEMSNYDAILDSRIRGSQCILSVRGPDLDSLDSYAPFLTGIAPAGFQTLSEGAQLIESAVKNAKKRLLAGKKCPRRGPKTPSDSAYWAPTLFLGVCIPGRLHLLYSTLVYGLIQPVSSHQYYSGLSPRTGQISVCRRSCGGFPASANQ